MPPLSQFAPAVDTPTPTGEALCLECAGRGTSCCMTDPELTHLSFPISAPEWRRILPFAQLATLAPMAEEARFAAEDAAARKAAALLPDARPSLDIAPVMMPPAAAPPEHGDAVCAAEPNTPDFIASMRALFPNEKSRIMGLFPQGGAHLTMKTRTDGSCVFLGSSGCRLPRSVRPWYCLIFPAWISGGALTLFLSEDCLISQRARGPAHGVTLLGITPEAVRELHARLCGDWGLRTPT